MQLGALIPIFASSVLASVTPTESLKLSLSDALQTTLARNQGLRVSKLNVQGERQQVDAALAEFRPKLLPSISLSRFSNDPLYNTTGTGVVASYGMQLRKKFDVGAVISAGPTYSQRSGGGDAAFSFSLSQPLLKGLGHEANLDGFHRAEHLVIAAKLGLLQSKNATLLETVFSFHEALKWKRIAELNQELCERLKKHVLLTGMKEKRGLTGPMDTYRGTIRLKEAEDAASQAENSYQTQLGHLRVLLDIPGETALTLEKPTPPSSLIDARAAEDDAIHANPELERLRSELSEADRDLRVADHALLPEVNLAVNYNVPVTESLPIATQRWSVTLQGSSDLFRSAERSNYQRSVYRAEAARLSLEHKTGDIRRQVRQQLRLIETAKERINFREQQIKEAEGKLALAKVKFSNDMADNFDVIESEGELQHARVALMEAQMDYALGIYELRSLTGHLLDELREKPETEESG